MSPPQNARPTLHSRRALPAHAKPAKPPPTLTSRKSSTGLPSKKSPTSKTTPSWSKSTGKREVEAEVEEDDMAGLPQFCATCEKQIVTPSNSILYCSESCRKKDHNKPLEDSILPSDLSPVSSRRTSYFGDDGLDVRSPIATRPPSLAFSDSSDTSSFYDRRSSYARNDSEAAHCLSQFLPSEEYSSHRGLASHSAAPSLSHTPSSFISASGSYRPLPRRGDPFSASFSSFSVDLITPVINVETPGRPTSPHCRNASVGSAASTDTAFRTADGDMHYEKKVFSPGSSLSQGNLKQLFSHKAMQSAPKSPARSEQYSASLK